MAVDNFDAPFWKVLANKVDITKIIQTGLISLTVTDNAGDEADTCEIQFFDYLNSIPVPPAGAEIEVFMGYGSQGLAMGKFYIDKRELRGPPRVMILRGSSVPFVTTATAQLPIQAKKSRSWDLKTILQIVTTIAAENGLVPQVAPAIATKLVNHIDQTDESDMHFLSRLAGINGCFSTVKGGKWIFSLYNQSISVTTGTPLIPVTLFKPACKSWDLELSSRSNWLACWASYYDKAAAKQIRFQVLADGVQPDNLPNGATTELPATMKFDNAADAALAAQGELRRLSAGSKVLRVDLARGNALYSAETQTLLSTFGGWDAEIVGTWNVKQAVHRINKEGYKTSLELVPG